MTSSSYNYDSNSKNIRENSIYTLNPGVSVMAITNRPSMIPNIIKNYISQLYPYKELIIAINLTHIDLSYWEKKYYGYGMIRFYKIDNGVTLGKCYNSIIPFCLFKYIAHFDDDDYYGPNYLFDMISTIESVQGEFCGKKTSYVYFKKKNLLALRNFGSENKRVYHMDGPTFFYKKSLALDLPFPDITLGVDTEYCNLLNQSNRIIYSGNRYHHAYMRFGDDFHTWKVNETELLNSCKIIGTFEDFAPHVEPTSV